MTIAEIIENALKEDLGDGDHTSLATIEPDERARAQLIIKESCVLCGMEIAREVFNQVDSDLDFGRLSRDGSKAGPGDIAFKVEGRARSILRAERTALNFMQRLSGIATYTRRLADSISRYRSVILDTRKTTPMLRHLEKYAVFTGGGQNHRMGLYDMIMIKDNHVDYAGGIQNAISRTVDYLRKTNRDLRIEIEVRNFSELNEVLETGRVDRIMLDNFSPGDLHEAVKKIGGRFETEASGGIDESNIVEYAKTGVDYISVGSLTHQIKSIDMSLKAF